MADQEQAPIIIKKIKGGHGGHHGGAWKVAYADFVTAMMALFIVLWLLSSDEKVKQAVGGYFTDPSGVGKMVGSNMNGSGDGLTLKEDDMDNLKDKIESALKQTPDFQKFKKNVQITVTGEGLRIEMLENEKGVFFNSGNAEPSVFGKELIAKLSSELGKLPNFLYMEGHTDAKPFSSASGYGNWELSTERANAARRIMQTHGVRSNQVGQVRGFADQRLRMPEDPNHASNRRISIIVQYMQPAKGAPEVEEAAAPGGHGEKTDSHGEKKDAHGGEKKAEPEKKPANHH
ncbi:MAG: OmpA family protein [Acidobacteria bacterium]|nr:OmpA family protein [Acidobacteriota bacterium]